MEILAPLPGTIVKIEIEKGSVVKEDDEVIIIEAMKMENPIYAPCDGTITDVKVKESDNVKEGDVLAIIE